MFCLQIKIIVHVIVVIDVLKTKPCFKIQMIVVSVRSKVNNLFIIIYVLICVYITLLQNSFYKYNINTPGPTDLYTSLSNCYNVNKFYMFKEQDGFAKCFCLKLYNSIIKQAIWRGSYILC